MKGRWLLTLAMAGLSVPATAQPNYQALQRNVVKIVAYHGEAFETGTGTIAGTATGGVDILTDLHVVAPLAGSPQRPDPPSKIEVFFAGDRATPVAGTWTGTFDDALDLTAVRVANAAVVRETADLADLCVAPDDPKDSDRISVMGHGLQDWQTLVNLNAVLAARADTDYKTFLISTTGLERGFSGGPVFSAAGCVIGIVRQLSARQALVTNIHDALRSATALGIHTELFRGSAPIDTQAKAQAFAELAKVLRTYLFTAEGVVLVYGRSNRLDWAASRELLQVTNEYNAAQASVFNDRERYRLQLSTLWNQQRLRGFDTLIEELDRFHKQLFFARLNPLVNSFNNRHSLTDAEQQALNQTLGDIRVALPSLQQQVATFLDDLQR